MYTLKIKTLKKFLLIFLCIFFAGINYLSYVQADVNTKSCNTSIDSDCDGLTNSEEALYGTNPNNPDTDGDGYSDGVEVKSGYDPLKPAPGDKLTTSSAQDNSKTLQSQGSPLTDNLINNLNNFIAAKGTQAISSSDINSFLNENLTQASTANITFDTLPEFDSSTVKTFSQSYSGLSETDKKKKLQSDSLNYISKVTYLLISNSPLPITNSTDLKTFGDDFQNHVASLANTTPDDDYFSDMGNRLNLFLDQLQNIEVPETLLPLHVKFVRLIKGYLELKNDYNPNDPIAKLATISKIQALVKLTEDFFANDMTNYSNQIN